jgi:hypothetical protein
LPCPGKLLLPITLKTELSLLKTKNYPKQKYAASREARKDNDIMLNLFLIRKIHFLNELSLSGRLAGLAK